MFFGAERGIHSNDRAAWVPFFDLPAGIGQIKGVDGGIQSSIDRQIPAGSIGGQKSSYKRPQTVPGNPIGTDTENDRRFFYTGKGTHQRGEAAAQFLGGMIVFAVDIIDRGSSFHGRSPFS